MNWNNYKFRRRCKNFFVFYCIVGLFFFSNYSFSRYITTSDGSGNLEIASPAITLSNTEIQCDIEDILPGEEGECSFTVSNKDESQLSEVSLNYYFIVTLNSKVPLKMTLYDVDNDEKISIDDDGKAINSYMKMSFDEEEEKSYKIIVSWDEKDNDWTYAGQAITLNVELKGLQIIE